ncbi:Alpha/Beta hydrolase protein [Biscogniauxia marginata]|nr:Alpha/Beta hydrolase protein [Biscogniauxia marginata]
MLSRYLPARAAAVALLLHNIYSVSAQTLPTSGAAVQCNNFNATHGPFTPTAAQSRIAQANISSLSSSSTGDIEDALLTAVNYERSNWAGTSVRLDPFYTDLPPAQDWSALGPGKVVKVEQVTDTSLYTLAHPLALSRIVFTTRTFNGTVVPASAYVLWPWLPRRFGTEPGRNGTTSSEGGKGKAKVPLIAWGHGTSGWSGECGPSHIRSLWYQFMIFEAAIQGYAVVAPDYAGLGIDHDGSGGFVPHEYLASRAAGYDLLYAGRAARTAWPEVLGEEYVVMGHSQGGGAAWGAAVILGGDDAEAQDLRKGYLGTVAGSPWTSFGTALGLQSSAASLASLIARVATGVHSLLPAFRLSDWLTPLGVRAVELMQDLQGCQSIATVLLSSSPAPGADDDDLLVRADWRDATPHAEAFDRLTSNIGRPVAGPLLVLQGTGDATVNASGVEAAVRDTCAAHPGAQIELVELEGVGHTGAMFAGQRVWLDWIADRFRGVPAREGCGGGDAAAAEARTTLRPLWDVGAYQKDRNWYIEWNQYAYGIA